MYHNITDSIVGLQGFNLEQVMGLLRPWMLTRGVQYQTGADYTEEELNQSLEVWQSQPQLS